MTTIQPPELHWTVELRSGLGDRLRALRSKKGVSAAVVCEQALNTASGSHATVSRLERGATAQPNPTTLAKLANYYGVSLDFLLGTTPATEVTHQKDLTFGERLKLSRELAGFGRAELASVMRRRGAVVVESDIERWETGSREPNPIQLSALHLALPTAFVSRPQVPVAPKPSVWSFHT